MANTLYTKGKEKLLTGAVDLSSHTIRAALMASTYVPNLATDEFFSTLAAHALANVELTGKTITGGIFDANDALFAAVTAGSTAAYVVIFRDTGDQATSPLLVFQDTITNFPVATNGGDITVQWDSGAYKIFAL